MGIESGSPLKQLFAELYRDILKSIDTKVELSKVSDDKDIRSAFGGSADYLSEHMMDRLIDARPKGLTAYFGRLDSETSPVQTFFCTDSFEEQDDRIYINGLECTW